MKARSKPRRNRGRSIARARGAVYVEFLIAFVPLLLFFGALLQLALLGVGSLMVEHSAVVATRAAVVVLPDDPRYYGGARTNEPSGQRLEDIRRAARYPLLAFERTPEPELTFSSGGGGGGVGSFGNDDLVRVRVAYDFPCRMPLSGAFVCLGSGGRVRLRGEAAFPNQGASYAY